ncbi:MAG: TatD family hydrolase, partial [Kiritimatiellales bacterium]|nr:TatD family hydrolase [Kiritimatiellales bacterium]
MFTAHIMFIDSHVHFDGFIEDGSFGPVLERALEAGVLRMIAVGGSSEANRLAQRLATEHSGIISATAGYDRDQAGQHPDMDGLRSLLSDSVVKAVGETGLDYYYSPETAAAQKTLFAENLALAAEFQKPAVVHTRDADEDTISILKEFSNDWKGDPDRLGVLHCFTREPGFARQVLDMGLY